MSSRGEWVTCRRGKGNARFTLIPTDPRAAKAIGRMPEGEEFGVRLLRDRSLPYHNRFWAMLDHVAKATQFATADRLLVALKLRLGRYDLCELPNHKVVPVPHSIAFAEMTQDEFVRFKEEAERVICEEVLPGYDPDLLYVSAEVAERPVSAPRARHAKTQSAKSQLRDMLEASAAQ
jgi:hypothetical protein